MALYNARSFSAQRMIAAGMRQAEVVEYTPGILCPCGSDPNESDPNCPRCFSTGHAELTEQRRFIRAVVSRFNEKFLGDLAALVQPGDVILSPLPRQNLRLSVWDVVRFPFWEDGESYQGDLVKVPDSAPYDVQLSFLPKRIDEVTSVVGPTFTFYQEGVDFTLEWHTMHLTAAVAGKILSVRYAATFEYLIVEGPHTRDERGSDFGQRALARRRDIYNAPGSEGAASWS